MRKEKYGGTQKKKAEPNLAAEGTLNLTALVFWHLLANAKAWHATLKARLRGEMVVQERCHHRLVRQIYLISFD